MLTKPFPPVAIVPDQPGHRFHCYNAKSVDRETCGCAVDERIAHRRAARLSPGIRLALIAGILSSE